MSKFIPIASGSGSNSGVREIKWARSSEVMKANFFEFLQNKKLADCSLCAEGKTIYGHRVILASASHYFKKLFKKHSSELHPVIHFNGISYMNLCLIMKYAYTGEVAMAHNRVDGFFEAARSLEMFGLMANEIPAKKKKKARKSRASTALEEARTPIDAQLRTESEMTSELNNLNVSESSTSSTEDEAAPLFTVTRKRKQSLEDEFAPQSLKKPKTVFFDVELSRRCKFCHRIFEPSSGIDLKSHEIQCSEGNFLRY